MKIFTDYMHGRYYFMLVRERDAQDDDESWAWYQSRIMEISDTEWAALEAHCAEDAKWQIRFRELEIRPGARLTQVKGPDTVLP